MLVRILLAILVGTMVTGAGAQTPDTDDTAKQQLASMKWMAGHWSGPMWGGTFEAYYTSPSAGEMVSANELKTDGKVTFYEFERFRIVDGVLTMTPYPEGKQLAQFKLVSCDREKQTVVFENQKKDFPTRIEYHGEGDKLTIKLTHPYAKDEEGKKKVEEFRLARKK